MANIGDIINGYTVTSEKSTSGQSYWFFATCGSTGRDVFIKAFLTPKKPTKKSLGGEEYKKKMLQKFEEFFVHQTKLWKQTFDTHESLLSPIDQFVDNTTFYKVFPFYTQYEAIPQNLSKLDKVEKIKILQNITEALSSLHSQHIVHSDIKLDNVLFTKERSVQEPFLIDYDGAFFCGRGNEVEDIFYDIPYASPELMQYNRDGDPSKLTKKSDIFALGILFHEIWSGYKPKFHSRFQSTGEAVLEGDSIEIDRRSNLSSVISQMLLSDPAKRPSTIDLLSFLNDEKAKISSSRLRISTSFLKKVTPKTSLKSTFEEKKTPIKKADITKNTEVSSRYVGGGGKLKTTIKK